MSAFRYEKSWIKREKKQEDIKIYVKPLLTSHSIALGFRLFPLFSLQMTPNFSFDNNTLEKYFCPKWKIQ